ncbi:zinc finger MYND domain-containing protein [Phanerochaete sordida]|uniref:Zinc finger MYND domain-containing protein n=1 Tax=Phanerochaete sordida TaxID=48140 RepID=A0A9P3GEC0_9APHY|nr:zinc finger MYND domain-containing protein [Phanerochaete sordida]
MLVQWKHIFPDDSPYRWDGLSRDAVLARLHSFPGTWPHLAREVCEIRNRDDRDAELTWKRFAALSEAVREAPRAVRREACAAGLVPCLVASLGDGFVCGYSRAQLITPEGARGARVHTISIMELFFACVERIIHDDSPEEVAQMLDVFEDTIIGVYVKLWDIRDPFLVGEAGLRESTSGNTSFAAYLTHNGVDVLLNILTASGRCILEAMRAHHRAIQLVESYIPHMFLLNWIYNSDASVRSGTLSHLERIIGAQASPSSVWSQLFSTLPSSPGDVTERAFTHAILRDLENESVVDKQLSTTLYLLSVWQERRLLGAAVPWEPKLAGYCIGVARRQLCRGRHTGVEGFLEVMTAALMSLNKGEPALSPRQCYGLLDLFCKYTMACLELPERRTPEILNGYLDWILKKLRAHTPCVRPKTVALRQRVYSAWLTLTDELARRRVAQRDTDWRTFVRKCETVRRLVEPEPGVSSVGAFAPLVRCGWSACLCSVAAPAHRMRVCAGCGLVAYCGRDCQKRDWTEGEHRQSCLRLTP